MGSQDQNRDISVNSGAQHVSFSAQCIYKAGQDSQFKFNSSMRRNLGQIQVTVTFFVTVSLRVMQIGVASTWSESRAVRRLCHGHGHGRAGCGQPGVLSPLADSALASAGEGRPGGMLGSVPGRKAAQNR